MSTTLMFILFSSRLCTFEKFSSSSWKPSPCNLCKIKIVNFPRHQSLSCKFSIKFSSSVVAFMRLRRSVLVFLSSENPCSQSAVETGRAIIIARSLLKCGKASSSATWFVISCVSSGRLLWLKCSWCKLIHGTRCWGRLGQDQNVQLEPQLPLPHKREKKSGMLWGSKIDRADRSFTSAKHSCKWVMRPSRNFWRIPLWNSCFMASEVWISWVLSWTMTSFDPWTSSTLARWRSFSAVILLKISLVDLTMGSIFCKIAIFSLENLW